jgi:hypothetical protein
MNATLPVHDYVAQWSGPDWDHVAQHPAESIRDELWPWLRRRGYASEQDAAELEPFLRGLSGRPAHLRPGLRLLRRWSRDEVAALRETGSLAATLRAEVNRLLHSVGDPPLPRS